MLGTDDVLRDAFGCLARSPFFEEANVHEVSWLAVHQLEHNNNNHLSRPFDNVGSLLRNSIHRSLQVRRRNQRQDARIYNPQPAHPVNS